MKNFMNPHEKEKKEKIKRRTNGKTTKNNSG